MGDRLKVVLVCEDCKSRNYQTSKAPTGAAERLTLKKYCPGCNKHTVHRESR